MANDSAGLPAAGVSAAFPAAGVAGGAARPLVIDDRAELLYLLGEAAELEHAVCCCYLYAGFTLKTSTAEGLTAPQLATVTRWKRTVAHIALQEMVHLALVNNLLAALGGAPHLGRPNLPQRVPYAAEIQLSLTPFTERTLERFLYIERPDGLDIATLTRDLSVEIGTSPSTHGTPLIVPQPQGFASFGALYHGLERGLAQLVERYGEGQVFVGSPRTQSAATFFAFPEELPELVPVADLASARQAMETIVEEGEGARGDWSQAHFGRFLAMLDEYRALAADDPSFVPARPVANNPYVRPPRELIRAPIRASTKDPDDELRLCLIEDRSTAQVSDLFNACYAAMLQILERFFAHGEETEAELARLADGAVVLMINVIRPLGELLTTMPVGPAFPALTAGPSFLVAADPMITSHKPAAWTILHERLLELAEFAHALDASAPAVLPGAQAALRQVAAGFQP